MGFSSNPQVATLSVFAYFFACLFGRQYLIPRESINDLVTFDAINVTFTTDDPYKRHSPDMYIPLYTFLEFFLYFGWVKVAETLLNPFGDDDEDFQINYLIDRNFQVSYLIVDEAVTDLEMNDDPYMSKNHNEHCHFDLPPAELPYKEKATCDCFKRIRKGTYKVFGKSTLLLVH